MSIQPFYIYSKGLIRVISRKQRQLLDTVRDHDELIEHLFQLLATIRGTDKDGYHIGDQGSPHIEYGDVGSMSYKGMDTNKELAGANVALDSRS